MNNSSGWCEFLESVEVSPLSSIHGFVEPARAEEFLGTNLWSIEIEFLNLIFGLIRSSKPKSIFDSGGHEGISTRCFALALKDNHKSHGARKGTIHSVELREDFHKIACENTSKYELSDFVKLYNDDTINFIRRFKGKPFDFLVFDSTRSIRVQEFKELHLRGLISKGAICVFHDTGPHWADNLPHKIGAQGKFLKEMSFVDEICTGKLEFPLARGLMVFQY